MRRRVVGAVVIGVVAVPLSALPAQADDPKEPGGWEWLYELNAAGPDSTEVTLTYDWSKVDDPKLLPLFPVVSEEQLDESLNRLAAAVSSR